MRDVAAAAKSIQEMLDEGGPKDLGYAFDRFSAKMTDMREQVLAAVPLELDPDTEDIRTYEGSGGVKGGLLSYRGELLDYFVASWVGNPGLGFLNMHFNAWVAPKYKIPHLGVVFGTVPDLFFYADFTPRVDMVEHADYSDRYYKPANDDFLALTGDERLKPFVSLEPYIRLSASPVASGYTGVVSDDTIDLVTGVAQKYLDRWLGWAKDPERTPADELAAIARRDKAIRMEQGHRDPANPVAVKFFGEEKSRRLLHGLWGMDVEA